MSQRSPEDLPPRSNIESLAEGYQVLLNARKLKLAREAPVPAHADAPPSYVYELRHVFSPLAAAAFMREAQVSQLSPSRVASNALVFNGLCSYYVRNGLELRVADSQQERTSVPARATLISGLSDAERSQATPGIARVRDATRAAADFVVMESMPVRHFRDEDDSSYYATIPESPLYVSANAAAAHELEREVHEAVLLYDQDAIVDNAVLAYCSLAAQERGDNYLHVHDPAQNEAVRLHVVTRGKTA